MRRLESEEDRMRGVVTYEFGNGTRVCLDARDVRRHGVSALVQGSEWEHLLPTERKEVMHDGRLVGSVPADFDPQNIRSTSLMYEPRPGDFKHGEGCWIADRTLGLGDLDAVAGFRWDASVRYKPEWSASSNT
jgi:hypothetical protein